MFPCLSKQKFAKFLLKTIYKKFFFTYMIISISVSAFTQKDSEGVKCVKIYTTDTFPDFLE